VLSVEDITGKESVSRCLALIKVTVGPDKRSEVLQLCEVFRARAVDVGPDTLIIEVSGDQAKIDGMLTILAPFGVAEMVQTGTVAMTRGEKGAAAVSATVPNLRGISAA
jgi:acetolactate synthase-1/3 small subunit